MLILPAESFLRLASKMLAAMLEAIVGGWSYAKLNVRFCAIAPPAQTAVTAAIHAPKKSSAPCHRYSCRSLLLTLIVYAHRDCSSLQAHLLRWGNDKRNHQWVPR